jgi:hypothetical protein
MRTLTVPSRGQITLRKDVLRQLGVGPANKIELELLPGGRGVLKQGRPSEKINDFLGLLAGQTKKTAMIDEISHATADGWAGKK